MFLETRHLRPLNALAAEVRVFLWVLKIDIALYDLTTEGYVAGYRRG